MTQFPLYDQLAAAEKASAVNCILMRENSCVQLLVIALVIVFMGRAEGQTTEHYSGESNLKPNANLVSHRSGVDVMSPAEIIVQEPSPMRLASAEFSDSAADLTSDLISPNPTPEMIAQIAAYRSTAAKLLRTQAQAAKSTSRKQSELGASALYQSFVLLQADRQAQIAAEKALEAYYGLAALGTASRIQHELLQEIDELNLALNSIVNQGFAVGDLTRLDRARIQANDAILQSDSGMTNLRSQLSLLVGSETSCKLYVVGLERPLQPQGDMCSAINQALCNRRDLAAWALLSDRLSSENLESLRSTIGSVTSFPSLSIAKPSWILGKILGKMDAKIESELQDRRRQLCEFQVSLRRQITVEVEVAWTDTNAALNRWDLANQMVASWRERLDQLDRAADLGKAFPEDRITAKLELKKSQLELVQRWNDFQQARLKLRLAIGELPTY